MKVVKLEQNYRSTQNILDVANEIISNNKGQIEKTLFTENVRGEKIRLVRTMTDNDEGKVCCRHYPGTEATQSFSQ